MSSAETLNLANTAGTEINPATEEGQILLLDELELKANLTDTQPVSVASLPLPAGASTEAKQDDAITQLTAAVSRLTSILAAQTDGTQVSKIKDSSGNVLDSVDGALSVHEVPHNEPEVSVHLVRETGVTDTLQATAAKGDRDILISNGALFTVGDKIKIIDGVNSEFDILTIKVITVNTLTLDRVLDAEQTAGREVRVVNQNMNVNGSVTPVEFSYKPRTGQEKYIGSVHIVIRTSTEPSLEKFGGIAALSYGVHFRVKNATGRDYTYWLPMRSNNSFVLSGFSYDFQPKVGGGDYFTHLKLNLRDDSGSIILLDDTQEFVCRIQDDLSIAAFDAMEVKISMYEH